MKVAHLLLAALLLLALAGPATASNIPYFTDPSFENLATAWHIDAEWQAGGILPAYGGGNIVRDGGEHRTGSFAMLLYPNSIDPGLDTNFDCYTRASDPTGDGINLSYYTDFGFWYKITNYNANMSHLNGNIVLRVKNTSWPGGGYIFGTIPVTGNVGAWTFYNATVPASIRAHVGNQTIQVGFRANKTDAPVHNGKTVVYSYMYLDDFTVRHIESPPEPVVPSFSANVTSGASPLHVNLYSTSTGTITSYVWHVINPDGTALASGGNSQINVTCVQQGTYEVMLGVGNGSWTEWAIDPAYLTVTTSAYDLALNKTEADVGEPVGATLTYSDISSVERIEYSAPISDNDPLTWQKFKKIGADWYKWSDATSSYSIASSLYEATHPGFVFLVSSDDIWGHEGMQSYVRVNVYSSSASLYTEQVNIPIADSAYYYTLQVFVFDARYSHTLLAGSSLEIRDYTAGTLTNQYLSGGAADLLLIDGHHYNLTAYKTGFVNQSSLYAGDVSDAIEQLIFSLSPYTAPGSGNITVRFQIRDNYNRWVSQPLVGIVRSDTLAENITTGTEYGIASFVAPADIEHQYWVGKAGLIGASGTFNSSTDLIITVNLTASSILTPTPTYPTTVITTPAPTRNLTGVDWRHDADAREAQAWGVLGTLYDNIPLIGNLFVYGLIFTAMGLFLASLDITRYMKGRRR